MIAGTTITAPFGLTSPQIVIMILLVVISLVCIGAMIHAVRQTGASLAPMERKPLLLIAGAVAAIGLMAVDKRITPYISPADQLLMAPPPRTDNTLVTTPPEPPINLTITADDCEPYTEGLTNQIIVTIEKRSDLEPLVTGCVWIAERQYTVESQQPVQLR